MWIFTYSLPIFVSESTRTYVFEVNWMVFSGYLSFSSATVAKIRV